jgi:hypothetical protein
MGLKLGVVDQISDLISGPGGKKKIWLVELGKLDLFFDVFVSNYWFHVGVWVVHQKLVQGLVRNFRVLLLACGITYKKLVFS